MAAPDSWAAGRWDNGDLTMTNGRVATATMAALVGLSAHTADAAERIRDNFLVSFHVEVAGADETGVASEKDLRASGLPMIPVTPSAASRDPLTTAAPKDTEKTLTPAAAATSDEKPTDAAQQLTPPASRDKSAVAMTEKIVPTGLFRPYLRIDGGLTLSGEPDGSGRNGPHRATDLDDAGLVDVGIGTNVTEQVRLEGMFTYRSKMNIAGTDGAGNSFTSDVQSLSGMLNAYYDFDQIHKWTGNSTMTPYIGGGAGVSRLATGTQNTTGGATENGHDSYNFSYALMAGVATQISDRLNLDFGYRFANLGQAAQDGTFTNGTTARASELDDLLVHEFRAGLRFQF